MFEISFNIESKSVFIYRYYSEIYVICFTKKELITLFTIRRKRSLLMASFIHSLF